MINFCKHGIWNRTARRRTEAGFTLLEMLVVLGILALLATIAYPQVIRYLGIARTETARAQIAAISTALELYALDNGGFPPQKVGLAALIKKPTGSRRWSGPYLNKSQGLVDPWGHPYHYRIPGRNMPFEVYTFGRDNVQGGTGEDGDIASG